MIDLTRLFVIELTIVAIVFMALGAFLLWGITDAIPYLWNHIHWKS